MTKTGNSDRPRFMSCFADNLEQTGSPGHRAHIAISTVICSLLTLSFKSRLQCTNVCMDPCKSRYKNWGFYNFKTSREISFNPLCTCYSINCNM